METKKKESRFTRFFDKANKFIEYCWTGVWKDTNTSRKVRFIKIANLSVRSLLDRNLQGKSMALTYQTVLAIVPAFAMLFAIGRGFGFQNLLEKQLFESFPAQRQMIQLSLKFVDSYLEEASQGIFVGVGLVFLLWTVISLMSSIEESFNEVWDIKHDRSLTQKVTDYIAICLMVPILLICSSGVSIFVSATIQDNLHFAFLTPLVNTVLELMPLVFAWMAFTLSFYLIPNTKVKFIYALISGGICAIAFQILQLLFLNGTIYVSKYNAIYGSFAFLPLLLIWLQLSWMILLLGCVVTYSMQNVLGYNFLGTSTHMSTDYARKVTVILMAAVTTRFRRELPTMTRAELSSHYDIPIRIVNAICERLHQANLVNYVVLNEEHIGIAPAVDTDNLTVGELLKRLNAVGDSDFIPNFTTIYKDVLSELDKWFTDSLKNLETHLIRDIELPEAVESSGVEVK